MRDNNIKDWKKVREEMEAAIDESEEALSEADDKARETEKEAPAYLATEDYLALQEKLTLTEQQSHENWEKSVRAMAELDNVRRRAERDVANAHRYGLEKIIAALLPVVDSLEQALQLADKETEGGMIEGLELTMKLFLDVLEKNKVEQLNPLGEMFNPEEHEAMSIQESSDAVPNSIVMVFQKGYKLNDRVIRPARVIVAKAKSSASKESSQ